MNRQDLPRIAITLGDPAGIGPEIVLKALDDPAIAQQARYVIVGDAWVLHDTAAQLGLPMTDSVVDSLDAVSPWVPTVVPTVGPTVGPTVVLNTVSLDRTAFRSGRATAACGAAAVAYIRAAVCLCQRRQADAMVTAPVNKEAVTMAGIPFTGHTEYIADLCGGVETRMLLVNPGLRVVHVTTHCSLQDACRVGTERILRTIELGHEAVRAAGVARPRIAVCGLNPHAGENGLFGSEDRDVILPAVRAARERGIVCDGPLPADTLFFKAVRGEYDLVVAMYHDQGHIPMKLLDFEHTVNVSLGLPIIRTSVDHGTAFDIVGKNQADPDSMKAALRLAATMAHNRTGTGTGIDTIDTIDTATSTRGTSATGTSTGADEE